MMKAHSHTVIYSPGSVARRALEVIPLPRITRGGIRYPWELELAQLERRSLISVLKPGTPLSPPHHEYTADVVAVPYSYN